ncbi:hypothetical protein [Vibrio sp. HN007]|uniref:hypothetical protein n=1 Tax=Vibrio iocasae TaxID=3098914 RepID=UPI0035D4F178
MKTAFKRIYGAMRTSPKSASYMQVHCLLNSLDMSQREKKRLLHCASMTIYQKERHTVEIENRLSYFKATGRLMSQYLRV